MKYVVLGVYLVDFTQNSVGKEIRNKHYAVILNDITKDYNTLLVAPITSKKENRKYKGGITIDCREYQKNPKVNKAFILVKKIREIDESRIKSKIIYKLNTKDSLKLKEYINKFFDTNIKI